jgi:hypothetical protein
MKEFDKPMVTISQEHFEQLQECKALINTLWMRFGPYEWPKEFRLPKGKTFRDLLPAESDDFQFYSGFTSRVEYLMKFDDSE